MGDDGIQNQVYRLHEPAFVRKMSLSTILLLKHAAPVAERKSSVQHDSSVIANLILIIHGRDTQHTRVIYSSVVSNIKLYNSHFNHLNLITINSVNLSLSRNRVLIKLPHQ